jgi:hypothetical protein
MVEEEGNIANETETFGFSILDIAKDIAMKNIPLSPLPHFRGMPTEDPASFYLNLTYCVGAITTQIMIKN